MSHHTADWLVYGARASRSGLFQRPRGNVPGRRVPAPPDTTHDNGTYLANVRFLDARISPFDDRAALEHYWHPPADGDEAHRMFPDAWTPMDLVDALVE